MEVDRTTPLPGDVEFDPTDSWMREAQTFPTLNPEMVARLRPYGTEKTQTGSSPVSGSRPANDPPAETDRRRSAPDQKTCEKTK
jgi:hypothetical protein